MKDSQDISNLTAWQAAELLNNKKISSVELTELYLKKIQKLDPELNSFITLTKDNAIASAKHSDQRRSKQTLLSPLDGVPIAHKDLFCTKNIKTTCGSKILSNFIPPYDAEVITRSHQAGLVMLGKTNMDEFAMGSTGEHSFYGPTKNPWSCTHTPGGSSSGSAAAIAGGLTPIATGTDTGGSIRQPASFSGLTGIKPTYGRISRYGMIAFASSLDQAGPMAKDAKDCAHLLNIFAGHDPKDATSSTHQKPDYLKNLTRSIAGKKIGLPRQFFGAGVDTEVKNKILSSLKTLESLGAELIHDVDLPHNDLAIAAYYLIAPAEASSNLSRFDGVRYGYRCQNPEPKDLEDLYLRTRSEGFGSEVKRRILIGTYVLSHGYYDAYYIKAQKIRRLISQDFAKIFQKVDLLAGPTCPSTAFKINEKLNNPLALYQSDANTVAVNLAGLPAISIPAGFLSSPQTSPQILNTPSPEVTLPVGLQLIGNYFQEDLLLNTAHQFQLHTEFHLKKLLNKK